MPVSKILKSGVTAEEILSPKPIAFELGGVSYPILPMPEGVLITVLDEMGKAAALFGELAAVEKLTVQGVVPFIPEIAKVLLPNATAIIAASLGKDAAWVNENFYLVDRLRALIAILKAEGVHLLAGEMAGGLELFKPMTPSENTTPSPAPAPTTS